MTTLYASGWIVTCDDEGTEHESGLAPRRRRRDRVGRARGRSPQPTSASTSPARSSRPASSTRTTTCTRPSREPAHSRPTSSAGCASSTRCGRGSTPRRSTRRREPGSRSWRCRAARRCSTTTTSSRVDATGLVEAEVQAARELGVRLVASRGSMDLGVSDGGLPPDELVEDIDSVLADTERLVAELHETGPGARVQIAVAPCSPFSVTKRLMTESAALARRLGLVLHTHLAETAEEEAYCLELYGATPVEYLTDLGWLGRRRLVRALRAPLRRRHRGLRRLGHGRRALPDLEPPARRGGRARARLPRRGSPGRPRRRRLGVERARRPPVRGEAGASRRTRVAEGRRR